MAQALTQKDREERVDALADVSGSMVDLVGAQLMAMIDNEGLQLPADYSISNALKSAWLVLQGVDAKTSSGYKPALDVCTKKSIANALLDMAVQALNPGRKQCYFIAYGTELSCQRSYFGDEAVAERVLIAAGFADVKIRAEVVYKDDVFLYELKDGQKVITKHEQAFGNISTKLGDIIGGYCVITCGGVQHRTVVRTIDQIKVAWKKSKTWGGNKPTFHDESPDHAVRRTVIRRACTEVFNRSNDAHLSFALGRQSKVSAKIEMAAEMDEKANQKPIALPAREPEIVVDEPVEPASAKLSASVIAVLKTAAKTNEVPWGDVEEAFGMPIEDLVAPTEAEIKTDVLDEIRKRGAKGESGTLPGVP